jgi:hypothetical protein
MQSDIGKRKHRLNATPALIDGNVYVRAEEHLFAFGRK